MLPLTRGSTMNCWFRIAAIARVTASISAFTKFSVTACGLRARAAALWPKAGGGSSVLPSIAPASAPASQRCGAGVFAVGFMLIRSI